MEELFELTVNNYKQPTTLPLRTYYLTTTNLLPYYYLTTTNTRSTKGGPKEHLWVRPRWVYGWDTNTCMGETPTPVWVRYLDSRGRANGKPQDRFSANPNGAPWVIWNRIGWKCVMLRVIPNSNTHVFLTASCKCPSQTSCILCNCARFEDNVCKSIRISFFFVFFW